MIVGLEAGGTVDTFARTFSSYLRKHIPGNPTIIVQNMPGAGGKTATNHVFERAAPDGLTILYGPWDPLAQALGDQGLRARYEKFEFLGGTGDIRVVYARRDAVAGGIKSPADIVKAETVGSARSTTPTFPGCCRISRCACSGSSTSWSSAIAAATTCSWRCSAARSTCTRPASRPSAAATPQFVKSDGIGIAYLVPVDGNGRYETSKFITEMPAFPDLYKQVHGKMPSGAMWDALNWLTNQTGELTFVGLAPPATPCGAARDPAQGL